MNTTYIIVRPVRRIFSKRQQWKTEVRSGGRQISDQESYFNRDEAAAPWTNLVRGDGPVVLIVQDRYGREERRETLR